MATGCKVWQNKTLTRTASALPAFATHELKHDPARIEEVQYWALPAGYTDESQVPVWGWGSPVGLYGFMSFCYNGGGY